MFKNYLTKFNNSCTSLYFDVLDYLEAKAITRKHKKEFKRKAKEQAAYDEACSNFHFVLDPYHVPERYVVFEGIIYRVQFKQEGVSITDQQGDFIECQLTRLKVLKCLDSMYH
ncbi:hypothetical protein L4D00_15020 [Photobacterium swingsii]|uniref:hypothetical protein n=1 Tax=Photobacterium swingsii TaxID=680026 RepID=UPI003D12AD93